MDEYFIARILNKLDNTEDFSFEEKQFIEIAIRTKEFHDKIERSVCKNTGEIPAWNIRISE